MQLINYHRSNYLPDIFTSDELSKIFEYLTSYNRFVKAKWKYSKWAYLRDYIICFAMYELAARPSEILRLKRCEIDFENGKVMINASNNHVHKGRMMYLSDRLKKLIEYYLDDKYTKKMRRNSKEYLFPTCISNFIGIGSWKFRFAEILKKSGIYKCPMRRTHGHLSSYTFRHTRAVHLYMETKDIEFVANYLGHTSYAATMVYVRLARLLSGYERYIKNVIEAINRKQNTMIYKHNFPNRNITKRGA